MYTHRMKKIFPLLCLVVLMSSCIKLPSSNTGRTQVIQKDTPVATQEWTQVTKKYWDSIHATGDKYMFPAFEFSYPRTWDFRCCSDMDTGSSHYIFSTLKSDWTGDESQPYVVISNEWMMWCKKEECGRDEFEKLSPEEKATEIINRTKKGGKEITAWPEELQQKFWEKFVFWWTKPGEKEVQHIWIQLQDASIWIDFYHVSDELQRDFIDRMNTVPSSSEYPNKKQ